MSKSRDAFRTISEVSHALDTPAHVLRFWESKFAQVKPVKRAGGRRYYRRGDIDLLAGIKQLLHDDGMTIKGAQKLMREKGVKHVSALGAAALNAAKGDTIEAIATPDAPETKAASVDAQPVVEATPEPAPEPAPQQTAPEPAPEPESEPAAEPEDEIAATNVVAMPPAGTKDLSLTLNLTPKLTPVSAEAKSEDEAAPKPATPDVPADPSDADSKAPARLFHLLHKARPEKLAARAEAIAPLLDRMQVLRQRIDIR